MITVLAILCGLFPQSEPAVDLIEINHYEPCGEHRFTQVIAWEWLPEYRTYHVQDWKIIDDWHVDERAGSTSAMAIRTVSSVTNFTGKPGLSTIQSGTTENCFQKNIGSRCFGEFDSKSDD